MKWRLKGAIALVVVLALSANATYGQYIDPTDPEGFEGGTVHILPNTFSGGGNGRANGGVDFRLNALPPVNDLAEYKKLDPNFIYRADPSLNEVAKIQDDINHQPLIHIKVRVIEVQRQDDFQANSILQYLSNGDTAGVASTLAGNTSRGFTNFTVPGLITNASAGSGALINLTSDHVNWVASFLATEFDGDLVTAPQVTTLNGKNVTFRAGSKVPFQLGSNVIQDGTSTIQQFLYKHVGTYVSVTPQIVNWGDDHKGRGLVRNNYYQTTKDLATLPVEPSDIAYEGLSIVIKKINDNPEFMALVLAEAKAQSDVVLNSVRSILEGTSKDKKKDQRKTISDALSRVIGKSVGADEVDRPYLSTLTNGVIPSPSEACLDWKAEDCTINLNIAVRLSEDGSINLEDSDSTALKAVSSEANVRAISNIVQLKSGNGVVIGGLISMRDQEMVQKVPVLGDLPYVGAGFRSKQITRSKFETLIFLEAEVLPPFGDSNAPLGITSADFCNAQKHLHPNYICCSALYCGLYEAALTNDYLPPVTDEERAHWAQWKVDTQLHDLLGN